MYPQMYAQGAWTTPGADTLQVVSAASGDTSFVCTVQSLAYEGHARSHDVSDGLKSYGLIVLCLLLLAYLFASRGQLKDLLRQVLLPGSRLGASDEGDVRLSNFQTLFFVVSCIIWVLVTSLMLQQNPYPRLYDTDWPHLYMAFLLTMGYVFLRFFGTSLFAWLHLPDTVKAVVHSLYVTPFCFVALFLAFLLLFNEIISFPAMTLLVASLSMWVISALLKLLTVLRFFSIQRVSSFHFILYFCGAEILPICLLCKGVFLLS